MFKDIVSAIIPPRVLCEFCENLEVAVPEPESGLRVFLDEVEAGETVNLEVEF